MGGAVSGVAGGGSLTATGVGRAAPSGWRC